MTGCGKKDEKTVLKEFQDKVNNTKSYYLAGNMELVNNEDIYTYKIAVSYKQEDFYKIELTNSINDHKQVILRNQEGVYVITPSLNKSFKFQSDWPYNNSQVYLIQSILDDINSDDEKSLVSSENEHIFTTSVNYPNNRKLVKQTVTFDKNLNLKKVSVLDENDISQMTMTFLTIDLNPDINNDTFDLNKIMNIEQDNNANTNTTTTSKIEDSIYPLYIPTGTVLTSEEKIAKTDGERIIMTFEGEKPFLLVEETSSIESEFSIIPTYGEPYLLIDTVGSLTDSSISWSSNGIDYYLVSDVISQDELLDIARSVNVIPTMK